MPNRLTGIVDIFQGIADVIGIGDRSWGAGAVATGVLLSLSPLLVRNQKVSRARRILLRAGAMTSSVDRNRLEAEALHEVKGNPDGLIVVAETALQRGRTELARTAVAELEATGKRGLDARRLRAKLQVDGPRSVDEAIVRIERLLGMGLQAEARERWEAACRKWPTDAELSAMAEQVGAATGTEGPGALP